MKISENMGHDGNIIYKWWIMYCHVWLPEGKSPPMGIDHHTSLGRFATSQDTLWKSTENPWKPAFSTAKSVCRWSSINVLWFPYNVVLQEFSSCSIGPKKKRSIWGIYYQPNQAMFTNYGAPGGYVKSCHFPGPPSLWGHVMPGTGQWSTPPSYWNYYGEFISIGIQPL